MSKVIRRYEPGTREYEKLEEAARLLTEKSPRGYRYYVGVTYSNFGYAWIWTTILCDGGGNGGYQALMPHDQKAIFESDDLEAVVDEILGDKYCPDKVCA